MTIGKLKIDGFLTGMVIAILLAALFPGPGAQGGWLHPELLTKLGIALIFFLNGAMLSFKALKDGVMRWRLHLIIQGATFVLFPVIGLVFLALAGHWISPDLQLGFFYLCALPSTVSSSVAMTSAARGNVPVAVFNATISSLIGIVVTPLWMSLLLKTSGHHLDVTGVFIDLFKWMVLPMIIGQLLRRWIGDWLHRHKKLAQMADRGTILLLVYTSFCDSFALNIWGTTRPLIMLMVIAATLILFFGVLLLLWKLCDRGGIAPTFRSAVVFCGTKKSLATGVPMASLIFVGHASGLGLILLPIMIYHPLQLLICTPLASRWAKEQQETAITG
ncbi:MAG: bile acid:sodium symporter family protein [Asticcacaulis sp.]|uniref:bile acid:sodium symporter family protein n=1 Tax=Asticcacaulis sp. TaxID=1872648 RepID=UPI0039E3C7CA